MAARSLIDIDVDMTYPPLLFLVMRYIYIFTIKICKELLMK